MTTPVGPMQRQGAPLQYQGRGWYPGPMQRPGTPGQYPGAPGGQTPTGPMKNPNAPTQASPQDLEKGLKDQVSRAVDLVAKATKALAALKKPDSKDKAAVKRYETQLASYKKQLAAAQTQLKTANTNLNKYYTTSGQYEKLLTGSNRDAFLAINSLFKQYGLQSLAGKIYDYVKNGYSADTISILLQDTQEYKTRFAGNEARKAAGLPVLSPGEYLATEASYRQIMQQAGLPTGFYDQNSDFVNWIGQNVSPSEIQSRVDLASQATVLANPDYRKALNQMGISDNDLTAYFLDPKKSLPILQKNAATAAVGAAAIGQGLTFDQGYAAQLATQGISADEARQGYSQVANELGTMRSLANVYGGDWTQRTSEEAIFQGTSEASQRKARLLSQERGAFSGGTGGARGGLSQSQASTQQ